MAGEETATKIREAGPRDVHALAGVSARAWRSAFEDLLPRPVVEWATPEACERRFCDRLARPRVDERLWIGERDGEAVGYVDAGAAEQPGIAGLGEVYGLYVAPEAWGCGIGLMLLSRAVAHLRQAGYATGVLWVFEDNVRARSFYARHRWGLDGGRRSVRFRDAEVWLVRLPCGSLPAIAYASRTMSARIVVAGVGESACGRVPDRSALQLHADAAAAAVADAGLGPDDVDGLFSCGSAGEMHAIAVAEHLGLRPRFVDSTQVGGASWLVFVEHAIAALRDGRCDVALLVYGSSARSDVKRGARAGTYAFQPDHLMQYEVPYGLTLIGRYALAARRHMHEYGTTGADLAAVAEAASLWAERNPRAFRHGQPVTAADVLASPLVCDPLHTLDCCLRTDGGGAVVLVRAERARDLPKAPVFVLGAAGAVSHTTMPGMDDLASIPTGDDVAARAFGEAGVAPEDVDVLQTYDSYTITVLLGLEAMGFCKPGESGPFAASGALAPGGRLPTNTDGGGLASNHPGMRGVFLLVEAVRQLRGESTGQVDGAEVAACFGVGGFLSSTAMVVLGR